MQTTAINRLKFSALGVFAGGFAAHASWYFGVAFNHDALAVSRTTQADWFFALGRFLLPPYFSAFGGGTAPWLVGLLSLTFLFLSAYLIADLFSLRSNFLIALGGALLSTSLPVILLNASAGKFIDAYMLAVLLNVLAVWLQSRYAFGFLPASALVCAAIGLYQGYVSVCVGLAMLLALRSVLSGESPRRVWTQILRSVAMLALGGGAYLVCIRITSAFIPLAESYHGAAEIGNFSGQNIGLLIYKAYRYMLLFFLRPDGYRSVLSVLSDGLLFVVSGAGFALIAGKGIRTRAIRRANYPLIPLILLLLPFGMNISYVLTKGVMHHLMICSFTLVYFAAIYVWEAVDAIPPVRPSGHRFRRASRIAVCVLMGITLFQNVRYANNVYLKKQLEFETTSMTMTRILDRIEQTDGYVAGETPVLFYGNFSDLPILSERAWAVPYTKVNREYQYLFEQFALTRPVNYVNYFTDVIGYTIRLLPEADSEEISRSPAVVGMPVFPAKQSCRIVDGVMVVKVSEEPFSD